MPRDTTTCMALRRLPGIAIEGFVTFRDPVPISLTGPYSCLRTDLMLDCLELLARPVPGTLPSFFDPCADPLLARHPDEDEDEEGDLEDEDLEDDEEEEFEDDEFGDDDLEEEEFDEEEEEYDEDDEDLSVIDDIDIEEEDDLEDDDEDDDFDDMDEDEEEEDDL